MTANLATILLCFAHTVGRVLYHLGAKPHLGSDSSSFDHSDCSGWVRWALDRAGFRIPDGSQTQWAWFREQAAAGSIHQLAHYSDVAFAKEDGSRLFIAFESDKNSGIGHVWLVYKGMTMECSGGKGVNSRPWQSLENICAACYEIPLTD